MERFILLLVLVSFVLNINARAFDTAFSSSSESDEELTTYQVIPIKPLNIFSTDEDSQHEYKLGQIGGLAGCVKNPNRLIVFHRASREWNKESFPDGQNFDTKKFSIIPENTILTINTHTGQIINQWGNNTFYMPHGLSVDTEANLWLTDVAMHQVFKYSNGKRVLTLGESFVPGSDSKHFCKPTDVAVTNDGSFIYVADGYCNSRIVKFDAQGNFLKEYLMPEDEQQLIIPHSILLIETLDLVCVADRENGRIVCFDTGNDEGTVKVIFDHPLMKTVYAIGYDANKHRLYAVSGKSGKTPALGFTFSIHPELFGQLIATWEPNDKFGDPHDLAVSVNGRSLFVGEISPNRIDSFDILN
jgi:DNA-binding beta-propeller fold protein YncE